MVVLGVIALCSGAWGQTPTSPPRRAYDIVETLGRHPAFTPDAATSADGTPPANATGADLARFFRDRAEVARTSGRPRQQIEHLRRALSYAERVRLSFPDHRAIVRALALAEADLGNYKNALDVLERRLPENHKSVGNHVLLGEMYARLGNLWDARRSFQEAQRQLRQSSVAFPIAPNQEPLAAALVLEAEGRWSEAEPHLRRALTLMPLIAEAGRVGPRRLDVMHRRLGLAVNLLKQGRPVDAEVEARVALSDLLAVVGKYSVDTAHAVRTLALIVARQGRTEEAEPLARIAVEILDAIGAPADAPALAAARHALGKIRAAQSRWSEAADTFEQARQGLGDGYLFERLYNHDLDVVVVLLKAGRLDAAAASLKSAEQRLQQTFGAAHPESVQALALRGLVAAARGQRRDALDLLRGTGPALLEQSRRGSSRGYVDWRLTTILEEYLDVLASESDAAAIADAFQVADVLGGRSVQRAVNSQAARAAAGDATLTDLARREQDLGQQIEAAADALNDLLAAPADQRQPATIGALRSRLASLTTTRAELAKDIERRFPAYAGLVSPPPTTIATARAVLRGGEALVAIYTGGDRTYTWTFARDGTVAFATAPIGRAKLDEMVRTLRQPLSSSPRLVSDIGPFDLTLAHEIYRLVLAPVERAFASAAHLLLAVHGPLSALPLAVLPTSPAALATSDVPFTGYRAVPWLARSYALSSVPSAQVLVVLRQLPKSTGRRIDFVGFGDPYFTQRQADIAEAAAKQTTPAPNEAVTTRSVQLETRGGSAQLGALQRLPETADEIRGIARALGGDTQRDVFLGRAANERTVKTMDLSNRRVVVFATHALIPGDLDGLDQPALALTAPQVAGVEGDGLLTMGEILTLRLDADWVVLSACNTGASAGAGAEAVSGLGRAFFYAGARALLVTHWPVETTSALRLTTGIFEQQAADATVSRADALRRSIAALLDRETLVGRDGRPLASYAHPFFWAPFVLVGDGAQ